MATAFQGRWRGTVVGRSAGFSQRVVVSGASAGNGTYNGVAGSSFEFTDGQVELEWNNEEGSGRWSVLALSERLRGHPGPTVVCR